ncbi:MAG: hypothetical protein ABS73_13065 [Paracoccus sp. SCN 68-21]|nr:MAG: hypothetical protein ABS73_13065 [Paracoccus sp. SCN 68-21]
MRARVPDMQRRQGVGAQVGHLSRLQIGMHLQHPRPAVGPAKDDRARLRHPLRRHRGQRRMPRRRVPVAHAPHQPRPDLVQQSVGLRGPGMGVGVSCHGGMIATSAFRRKRGAVLCRVNRTFIFWG